MVSDFDFVCEKCRGERRRSESDDALEEKEGWKEKNAISQTSLDKKKTKTKHLREKKKHSPWIINPLMTRWKVKLS